MAITSPCCTLYTNNTKNPINNGLTEEFKLHNQEYLYADIFKMETNVNSNYKKLIFHYCAGKYSMLVDNFPLIHNMKAGPKETIFYSIYRSMSLSALILRQRFYNRTYCVTKM
jgi:hypothetical protein